VTQAPLGFAVMPRRWTLRHDEQDGPPLKQQGVDADQVGGEDAVCWGGQELSPGGIVAAGRGVDAGSRKDQPHGAECNRVTEPGKFTVDPPVAPSRVL
jgi:hypothetical protein